MITEYQNGNLNSANSGIYSEDIKEIALLEKELMTAYNKGKLSPEQAYRYQQIQAERNLWSINAGIDMGLNMTVNVLEGLLNICNDARD